MRLVNGKLPWPYIDPEKALPWIEQKTGLSLAESQIAAIRIALLSKVLVIIGGPGVGKTTIVNSILRVLAAKGVSLLLCAPTGRAAKRMTEATGFEAKTIHRLLEVDPKGGGFKRDSDNPLDCDLLVIDETSMVDVMLMQALMRAVPDHAALLIVGDIDQLPSVGPGQVLADVIASGAAPVVPLTEVFRQAAHSRIITSAHQINRGSIPDLSRPEVDSDFYFVQADDPETAVPRIIELVKTRIPQRFGLDPVRDIQVLCPMNRGGVGARSLNIELQAALNPAGERKVERFGWTFAPGDKIMQIENDYDKDVYNGDIGYIDDVDPDAGALTDDKKVRTTWLLEVKPPQGSSSGSVVFIQDLLNGDDHFDPYAGRGQPIGRLGQPATPPTPKISGPGNPLTQGNVPCAMTQSEDDVTTRESHMVAVDHGALYHSMASTFTTATNDNGTTFLRFNSVTPWTDMSQLLLGPNFGVITGATVVASRPNVVSVLFVVQSNGGFRLFHTVRLPSGQWRPADDVLLLAGASSTGMSAPFAVAGGLCPASTPTQAGSQASELVYTLWDANQNMMTGRIVSTPQQWTPTQAGIYSPLINLTPLLSRSNDPSREATILSMSIATRPFSHSVIRHEFSHARGANYARSPENNACSRNVGHRHDAIDRLPQSARRGQAADAGFRGGTCAGGHTGQLCADDRRPLTTAQGPARLPWYRADFVHRSRGQRVQSVCSLRAQ